MHILLVRFSSMGDVVLQTATVNWLRSLFKKNLRITFLTSSEFVTLLDQHPEIDAVIGFNRKNKESWKDLVKKINQVQENHPIDLILDLHATLRSFRLKLTFWSIPHLTVDKRRWERFLLTKVKIKWLKKLFNHKFFGLGHQVERIIEDFENIFSDSQGKIRTMSYRNGPHGELTSLATLPPLKSLHPYIVIAPSASYSAKRWPVSSYVELSKLLLSRTTYHLIVLAGPVDNFCDAFNEISSERFKNLQGKTSLKETMSLLSQARLCIGNDSGMNHIAEAYGVPCVTLFGPTDPRFGFAPHGSKSCFLEKELFCRPCSTTGKDPCYRDRHYCMEEISIMDVMKNVEEVLEIL